MSAVRNLRFPFTRSVLTAATVLAFSAGHCFAQRAEPAPAAQPEKQATPAETAAISIAPEAQRVLDRVSEFYAALPGASVKAVFSVKAPGPEGAPGIDQKTEVSMAASDPNKFVFPLNGEGEFDEFKIVSTGEKLYMFYAGPLNKYVERDAPRDMDAVIEAMSMGEAVDVSSYTSPIFPFLKLMGGGSLADVQGVTGVEYVGAEELMGTPHDRIRIVSEQLDVDMWVRQGEEAWVSQVKPDAGKSLKELGELGKSLEAQMPQVLLTYSDWQRREEFPQGTFAFTPPEGSERVDSLMEAMREQQGGAGEGGEPGSQSALLGKPAPELKLPMLGGGTTDLASVKDKVVLLDFWASWCPPCVRGLPAMARIADKYKDRVVFYAVNSQEEEATVRRFLEKQKLNIPVALDTEGKAGDRYGVTGIPQTVLIGKDGTVQAVHVGYTPEMEQEISKQIEKLLAGEKLVKPD